MADRMYVDALNGLYEPDCDLDALEDLLLVFHEYLADGFGEGNYPAWWKPIFCDLEGYLTDDEPIPASLVERWINKG